MKVFIYKRTHIGDPDEFGRFGINRCVGWVRSWQFDAVIGVGGCGPEPKRHDIDRRVTWVGISPKRSSDGRDGHPVLTFHRFCLLDTTGPWLKDLAPRLAKKLYVKDGARFLLREEDEEIKAILKLAQKFPGSSNQPARTCTTDTCKKVCPPRNRRTSRKRTC